MNVRIDGHSCNGCYSLRNQDGINYCRSYNVCGGVKKLDNSPFISLMYHIITLEEFNDSKRPTWCPLEQ